MALKSLGSSLAKRFDTGNAGTSEASSINAKARMIQDYNNTYGSKPATPAPAQSGGSSTPINPKAKYGDRPGEKRIDTTDMTKPLGSFKKGGKVKKTGIYKLHKGERVLNTAQVKKGSLAKGLSSK